MRKGERWRWTFAGRPPVIGVIKAFNGPQIIVESNGQTVVIYQFETSSLITRGPEDEGIYKPVGGKPF